MSAVRLPMLLPSEAPEPTSGSTAEADAPLDPAMLEAFLEALAECGNVSQAARDVGARRFRLYAMRDSDPAFAKQWEKAAAIGLDALEDQLLLRACEGWEEAVWYRGECCGSVRKYSDTLLLTLLKNRRQASQDESERSAGGDPHQESAPAIDLGERSLDELIRLAALLHWQEGREGKERQ